MGPIAYIMKARTTLLRDLGGAMSPFNAWSFIQGLETLPLRMREHGKNALQVAQYLADNSLVSSVTYPGISEGISKERADSYSRSLAIHPASTTHSQLTAKEQLSAGVTPGYVRLSVGIENVEDIIDDIDQAIKKAS